jgi:hypothetical protein
MHILVKSCIKVSSKSYNQIAQVDSISIEIINMDQGIRELHKKMTSRAQHSIELLCKTVKKNTMVCTTNIHKQHSN